MFEEARRKLAEFFALGKAKNILLGLDEAAH